MFQETNGFIPASSAFCEYIKLYQLKNEYVLCTKLYDQEVNKSKIVQECDHNWQKYQGFNEFYDFCTKCDKKKKEQRTMKLFLIIHSILWILLTAVMMYGSLVWTGSPIGFFRHDWFIYLINSQVYVFPASFFIYLLIFFIRSKVEIRIRKK